MARLKAHREMLNKYFTTDNLPTAWCPGCGCGIVAQALVRAMDGTGIHPDKLPPILRLQNILFAFGRFQIGRWRMFLCNR